MFQPLPTPTLPDAIDYVQTLFAVWNQPITICGSIAPGSDSFGPIPNSRDVLFLLPGEAKPNRMTVWHEQPDSGGPILYGEW